MLRETGRQVMGPICGSGEFLAYGSPSISAAIAPIYGNAIAPMQDNQLGDLLNADANDE